MGSRQRPKMSPQDRAKQFMPFDAVKGLREALMAKEAELLYVEKQELSEEAAASVNEVLASLRAGDHVSVTYFEDHSYRSLTGVIRRILPGGDSIELEEKTIPLSDIFSIVSEETSD